MARIIDPYARLFKLDNPIAHQGFMTAHQLLHYNLPNSNLIEFNRIHRNTVSTVPCWKNVFLSFARQQPFLWYTAMTTLLGCGPGMYSQMGGRGGAGPILDVDVFGIPAGSVVTRNWHEIDTTSTPNWHEIGTKFHKISNMQDVLYIIRRTDAQ